MNEQMRMIKLEGIWVDVEVYAVGQISLTKDGLISARELAHPCLESR